MRTATILSLVITSFFCFSQDYKSDFNKYLDESDSAKQHEVLIKWENDTPKDAELFTCYFNFYFNLAEQEVLSLSTEEPDGEGLILTDSLGNTAGYMGTYTFYDSALLEMAFHKIDEGIKLYPNRLDMRFGKIFVLGRAEIWDRFTEEIIKTISYSATNNNNWTWTNNEEVEDGKEFFLSNLQDYQLTLYDTGDDSLLFNMRSIGEEILKYYPEHIESLSNVSITYIIFEDYDKAIEYLQKATEIDPIDGVVLSNLAYAYKLKGDKKMAIKYYKKMLKLDEEEAVEFAKKQIEELEK
jgi:tetratricopeptide (TPR) repeat protein